MLQAGGKKKVLIVDDHPIVRQGLSQLIGHETDLLVCGEADCASEALQELAKHEPHVVILDLTLGADDGFDLIRRIRREYPGVLVLVLTMHDETYFAEQALRAGAGGYLTKQEAGENVVTAIRSLLEGEIYVSEHVSPKLIRRLRDGRALDDDSLMARLSDRERQVFTMIGSGDSAQEIARALDLSVRTVEAYRTRIREKLHLRNSMELTRCAVRWTLRHEVR